MNKLKLEYLAPYLHYKLLFFVDFKDGETSALELEGLTNSEIFLDGYDSNYNNDNAKPILRPMRDISNYIDELQLVDSFHTHYCHTTNTIKLYPDGGFDNVEWAYLTDNYILLNKLFELHFDIFGLIEKGLAVDINKI